jgi:hypothetical protein
MGSPGIGRQWSAFTGRARTVERKNQTHGSCLGVRQGIAFQERGDVAGARAVLEERLEKSSSAWTPRFQALLEQLTSPVKE